MQVGDGRAVGYQVQHCKPDEGEGKEGAEGEREERIRERKKGGKYD